MSASLGGGRGINPNLALIGTGAIASDLGSSGAGPVEGGGVFDKLEGFILAARQLENALGQERARSRKFQEDFKQAQAQYDALLAERDTRLRELEISESKARNTAVDAQKGEAKLQGQLEAIAKEYKKIKAELNHYKAAWADVLQREKEAKLIIADSEKLQKELQEIQARQQALLQSHASEKSQKEQFQRHAKSYQTELQNTLLRLHSAESKFAQLSKELEVLSQVKRSFEEEVAKIEKSMKERFQWSALKERERMKAEIEREASMERERFRKSLREAYREEMEREIAFEREKSIQKNEQAQQELLVLRDSVRRSEEILAETHAQSALKQAQWEQERAELKAKLELERDNLRAKLEQERDELKARLEKERMELLAKIESDRAEAAARLERERQAALAEREREKNALESQWREEKTRLEQKRNIEIQQLESIMSSDRSQLESRIQAERQRLEAKLEVEKSQLESRLTQATAERDRVARELRSIQEQAQDRSQKLSWLQNQLDHANQEKNTVRQQLDHSGEAMQVELNHLKMDLIETRTRLEGEKSRSALLESALLEEKERFERITIAIQLELEELKALSPLNSLLEERELEIALLQREQAIAAREDEQKEIGSALEILRQGRDELQAQMSAFNASLDDQLILLQSKPLINILETEPVSG